MKKEFMKTFAWGMAAGSILLLIVIFSTGWVVTSGSAKSMAREIAATAVIDRLAPIAVAQFMQDPNKNARLKDLKALETWKRSDFIKAQGWAIMPGEKDTDYNVAVECARQLVELKM